MLTLWRPHNELLRWNRELEGFFDAGRGDRESRPRSPEVDIAEIETGYVLTADLPGVEEKDIEVSLEDGVLTVSGRREEAKDEGERGRILHERSYGSFYRRFKLGPHVNPGAISASYKNGVLTVVLPKA